MSHRSPASWGSLAAVFLVVALVPGLAAGQAAPRTAWGAPDLQGVWTSSTLTPLERPSELAGKEYLTEEEATALERRAAANQFVDRPPREGDPGTYNQVWFDRSTALVPNRRTSLIVSPPDGRIPYTPEARARQADNAQRREFGPYHSWLDIDTGERCITDGVPMIWQGYNANHQIVQTPDHVVIVHEMFNQYRIIPLDGRPHLSAPRWNGDMRGRWEGDTLVVESTNFADKTEYRWANVWREPSPTMHLVERFTRVDAHTIMYRATITDPSKFTSPWTVELPLTTNQAERGVTTGSLYEYACHEGNRAMTNVLSGARAQERASQSTR